MRVAGKDLIHGSMCQQIGQVWGKGPGAMARAGVAHESDGAVGSGVKAKRTMACAATVAICL